jgi:O-methyltransferase
MGWRDTLKETREIARLQQSIIRRAPTSARPLFDAFQTVSANVDCPHNPSHILKVADTLLNVPGSVPGVFVEAGCYKGGSTAKLSHVAAHLGRRLVVFDSFEGLPANSEDHEETIDGADITGWFTEGAYAGTLDEVKANVSAFGRVDVCEFIPGWFEETMPDFSEPVAAAFLDVDLAESTRTCLRYLWPLLQPGGFVISQDGDFPLVLEVFTDTDFWDGELASPQPEIHGFGEKILTIRKGHGR